MSEVVAAVSWRAALVPGGRCHFERDSVEVSPKWWCNVKQLRVMKVEAQMMNPSTCSSRISIDIPLHEIPGASFDQYLEDKPRVFEAICPDKLRSHQINEEEWRVEMIPIQFLFLTASPVVDMRLRLRSSGIGYPPQVPPDISKVLDLEIVSIFRLITRFSTTPSHAGCIMQTRWELEGLDEMLEPSQLCLSVKGALYPDRRGPRSSLKGHLQMNIGFVLPRMLALLPQQIRQDVAETVSKRLVENMKSKVSGSLIADYNEFKKERPC